MKKFYELVVVIPIGPQCKLQYIVDTINSVLHYTYTTSKIILADDSQTQTGALVKQIFPDVDVIAFKENLGKFCGLYINLSYAFKHALKCYSFHALLRMDTDALIIGSDPAREAIELFLEHPEIGIAGQYPNDYDDKLWDRSWPYWQLSRFTHIIKMWKRPLVNIPLRKYFKRAVKHGYEMGESVFGGACFYSERCLQKLNDEGLLPLETFKTLELEEDHLFAILVKSTGMQFGDLSTGDKPFACAWKYLPNSPEYLYKEGKKIIHSVRAYKEMTEPEIRNFFIQIRQLESSSMLIQKQ
jgi:hypothetical protein